MDKRELQEKVTTYRALESRFGAFIKQRDLFISKLSEIQTTLNSMEEIEKGKEEILFPLGSEAYAFGKVVEKKRMIIEIGAGIALEKTPAEGMEILKKRMEEIEKALNSVLQGIVEASSVLGQLESEIQEEIEKEQAQAG